MLDQCFLSPQPQNLVERSSVHMYVEHNKQRLSKRMLQSKNTVLVNIPPGCTSKVQPLEVSINKPFKDYLRTQFEKHRDENIELYISNKLTASKRRVLVTKWVAET